MILNRLVVAYVETKYLAVLQRLQPGRFGKD